MQKKKKALVAIGGNSLIKDSKQPDVPHQWEAVRETCRHLADMVEAGWQLIITHGNGPQVGFLLRRNELAAHELHVTPLDLLVADTQGAIGYMLQQALGNELMSRGINIPIVSLVTQVLVDPDDPGFSNPNKPIGTFLSQEQAEAFTKDGWTVVEDSGRGWRRVVASPQPLRIIEQPAIEQLLDAGCIVIAVGGGGIPVVQNETGELRQLRGVYAVIDKDRASSLLARELSVDLFLISTGVEQVSINFNKPNQQNLHHTTTTELAQFMDEGHFAPGSMLPKIESVLTFLQDGTAEQKAIITNPSNLLDALENKTGTHVQIA